MPLSFLPRRIRRVDGGVSPEWWWSLIALGLGVALLAVVVLCARSPAVEAVRTRFHERVTRAARLQPLSPLVVTVYERATAERRRTNQSTVELARGATDVSYNERLVVVKPHNWLVYTNNGVNFYLISNNVSNRTAQCDLDRQTIAVEFRLLARSERDTKHDTSGRLKVACLNYTLDNLIRLFGLEARRTYVDLSRYFDRAENPRAPDLLVEEILEYLLRHGLL